MWMLFTIKQGRFGLQDKIKHHGVPLRASKETPMREKKKKRERSLGAKVSIDSCEGGGRRELVIFFFFFHCMYVQGGRLVREED